MHLGPALLVPQPLLGDSQRGAEQMSVNPSLPATSRVLLCPEVEHLLPCTALCSALEGNLTFCSGLKFKEEKGSLWKSTVTTARFFRRSLPLPLLFSPSFLVLVRVCDSS